MDTTAPFATVASWKPKCPSATERLEKSRLVNSNAEQQSASWKVKPLLRAARVELPDSALSARNQTRKNTLWDLTARKFENRQKDSGLIQVRMGAHT